MTYACLVLFSSIFIPVYFLNCLILVNSFELLFFQVNALLCSLEIDSDIQAKGPPPGRFRELEEYWNESQGALGPGPHAADGWIAEFGQHRAEHGGPDAWAHSFVQQHGANGWASEFEQVGMYCNCYASFACVDILAVRHRNLIITFYWTILEHYNN